MATKATKPGPFPVADLAIESDELHQPEIDAFIARNRDALNESLQRSYEEIARGEFETRTIEQIIAEGKERHRARRAT
jgi:flagellar biosynthesis/type III secretory pathway protein FliH